jgi:glycerate-2-kinase
LTATPCFEDRLAHVEAIVRAAVGAADPAQRVFDAVMRDPPPEGEPVSVVAIGKAAGAMFEGFREATGRHHDAVMVVPDGVPAQAWAIRADHPLPTVRSLEAGEAVREFVRRQAMAMSVAGHGGFVVLISGGASALVTLPVPSIPLARYRDLTDALLRSGEPIGAVNTVRRHCEVLKGGRLAALMEPAWVSAYILSDVIGDEPADIASGPVSPDPTTFERAYEIVARVAPEAREVLAHLDAGRRGLVPETLKPGDPVFAKVKPRIVGSNRLAVGAAKFAAEELGFGGVEVGHDVTGEAREVGAGLGRRAIARAAAGAATAIVLGGETTVTVGPVAGVGGRCQELALSAAVEIEGQGRIVVAAFATDGADGPAGPEGPAPAGAVVTGQTGVAAREAGVDPGAGLANHDARRVLEAAGALMETGPTGTNVNDLAVALIYSR